MNTTDGDDDGDGVVETAEDSSVTDDDVCVCGDDDSCDR